MKGEPFSEDHIDEGSTYLIHLIKTVTNWRPDWSREQHLKGQFRGIEPPTPLKALQLRLLCVQERWSATWWAWRRRS